MATKRQGAVHKHFQIARKAADARLKRLPNVVGTCLGLRERDGKKTNEVCLTVFVRNKRPESKLPKKGMIPSKVVRHGKELATDVIEILGLEKQLRFGIQDGVHAGTLGCFGRKGAGDFYGVSCAHCIGGPDNDTSTPNDIVVEYPNDGNFMQLGPSANAVDSPGTGVFPQYGALDSGLIHVNDATILTYASGQPELPVLRFTETMTQDQIANTLQSTPVTGWGAKSGLHNAIIAGVFCHVFDQFFDLMITDPTNGPLTEPGDSGLVWLNPFDRAVGFHMQGDVTPGGGPSVRAFGAFAFRAADELGLTLFAA